jgi:hypothetical protein
VLTIEVDGKYCAVRASGHLVIAKMGTRLGDVARKLANKLGDSVARGGGAVCLAEAPPRQNLSMRDVLQLIDERHGSEGVRQTTIMYKLAAARASG